MLSFSSHGIILNEEMQEIVRDSAELTIEAK
jgi:hypothetical protein